MTKKEQQAIDAVNRREQNRLNKLQNEAASAQKKLMSTKKAADDKHATFIRKMKALHCSTIRGIVDTVRERGASNITEGEVAVWGRSIGSAIYDMSVIPSGYVSKNIANGAIDPKTNKKFKRCPEHFYPRQVSGEFIVKHIMRFGNISIEQLTKLLIKYRQIHYVTPDENTRLREFQKGTAFEGWEAAYHKAGIELVKDPTKDGGEQSEDPVDDTVQCIGFPKLTLVG